MAGSAVNLSGMLNNLALTPFRGAASQEGLLGSLGAALAPPPAVDTSNPEAMAAHGQQLIAQGRVSEGIALVKQAQAMQNQVAQAAQGRATQVDALQARAAKARAAGGENDVLMAEIQANEKLRDQSGMKKEQLAAVMDRMGKKDIADIIRSTDDTDLQSRAVQAGLQHKKETTTAKEVLNESTGNMHWVMFDEQGKKIEDMGISEPAVSAVDQAKMDKDKKREYAKSLAVLARSDAALDRVKQARELVEDGGAGPEYELFRGLPIESDSRKLAGVITELEAELGFGRLTQMRAESPTGGALGQVSNMELTLLKSAVARLDPTQGAEFFKKQLDKVVRHYENMKAAELGNAPKIDWSDESYAPYVREVGGVKYFRDNQGNFYLVGAIK